MTEAASSLPFAVELVERVFSRFAGPQGIRIHEVLAGNINTIVKVEHAGRMYGLRVRTHEQVYRYEPDMVKEAFVVHLLDQAGTARSDTSIGRLFSALLSARCGTVRTAATALPWLEYYDWTREILAHPYCVYRWVEGTPLWDTPQAELYRAAGHALAQIHTFQFTNFYADFTSIGKQPVHWAERFRGALDKEIPEACRRLPHALSKTLEALDVPQALALTPCLVHNDYAPGNIIIHDGELAAVIDWDNAVIDAPPLDFVKMKYWTAKGARGQLGPEPTLFEAFVNGYGPAGQEIVESLAFALYEVLWLLRVFNFERSKQEQGLERAPGYPEAAVYEGFLVESLARLKKL